LAVAGQMIPLQQQILEVQRQALEQVEELRDARPEIARLKDDKALEESLSVRDQVIWWDGARIAGPFCATCWGLHRKLILMEETGPTRHCHSCKSSRWMPGQSGESYYDDPLPRDPV